MESYKTCPSCKTNSSLSTEKCRGCGRVFKTIFPDPVSTKTKGTPLTQKQITGIIASVCIIVSLVVMGALNGERPDPGYKGLAGNVYSGVNVYRKESHEPLFQIIGGGDNHLFADGQRGRGLKVIYTDGSVGWEMRDDAIYDKSFIVKEDDPALDRMQWTKYEF